MHFENWLFTNHIEWLSQFVTSNGSTLCLSFPHMNEITVKKILRQSRIIDTNIISLIQLAICSLLFLFQWVSWRNPSIHIERSRLTLTSVILLQYRNECAALSQILSRHNHTRMHLATAYTNKHSHIVYSTRYCILHHCFSAFLIKAREREI